MERFEEDVLEFGVCGLDVREKLKRCDGGDRHVGDVMEAVDDASFPDLLEVVSRMKGWKERPRPCLRMRLALLTYGIEYEALSHTDKRQ